MIIAFLAFLFAVSLLIAAGLTPPIARLARRRGFMDQPGPRKVHADPVPYGGGLAVAAGVFLPLLLGLVAARLHLSFGWFSFLPEEITIHAKGVFRRTGTLAVFSLGAFVILLLGVIDDRRKLSAGHKLLIQAIVAAGVALGGERLDLFGGGPVLGSIVTVLWILAVTNAFNLLDHMDGLSSGVAAIAGVTFLAAALQTGQLFIAAMLVPLLGACCGFLIFNFSPAKIFLGDAGSLFVGFWLACLTIPFTFYEGDYLLYTYLVPVAVLAVPLFDTAGVVLIRLRQGRSIFEADTNHLAHRLRALGMSTRGSVLTIYILTLYAGLSAVLLYHVHEPAAALIILAQLMLTFGIMTLLEIAGRARGNSS